MAAKTTWGPAPWLDQQTWLLKDGSVVQSPDVETTTSGSRIRVAGTKQSFGKTQLYTLQTDAVRELAKQRLTEPWVQLNTDEDNRQRHGAVSPGSGSLPDFSRPATMAWSDPAAQDEHIQIVFEFESIECPSITAIVWVIIERIGYRNSDNFRVLSALTYRVLHETATTDYARYGSGGDWYKPYSYYDQSPEADAGKEFLNKHKPLPDVDLMNEDFTGPRNAVVAAINLVSKIRNVETVDIPVWRDPAEPSLMTFKFKRTNLTTTLYQDLVEFTQVKPTLDRIKQNYEQIQRDLSALGIVMANSHRNHFVEIVNEAFAEDVVCHMIPVKERDEESEPGATEVILDDAHTVSVDLMSGTIVVSCAQDDTDVLEHWNFERMKAELKGELDAFLGYCRQKQNKRVRKTFNKIVKHRTPETVSLDKNDGS